MVMGGSAAVSWDSARVLLFRFRGILAMTELNGRLGWLVVSVRWRS